MTAEIIAVGTEITRGYTVNTNAAFLARRLFEIGIDAPFHTAVPDSAGRLKAALRLACRRAGVIVLTGGLGPTDDDLTKEALCDFLGLKCVLSDEIWRGILCYFAEKNIANPSENNKKQAMIPEGAIVLKNGDGTAPGFFIERNGKIFIVLPGPPNEARGMFTDRAEPLLKGRSGAFFAAKTLKLHGIGESRAEAALAGVIRRAANPYTATYTGGGGVTVRVAAKAKRRGRAEALAKKTADDVRAVLSDYVYSDTGENLENAAFRLLREKKLTFAAAESCTGGLIASRMVANYGASEVFLGGVVAYGNEAKKNILGVRAETLSARGAVSRETALEMTRGARKLFKSDMAVGATGFADDENGHVFIATVFNETEVCREFRFSGKRAKIRRDAANAALYMAIELCGP